MLNEFLKVLWVFLTCNQGWKLLTELERALTELEIAMLRVFLRWIKHKFLPTYAYTRSICGLNIRGWDEITRERRTVEFICKCYWTQRNFTRILPVDKFWKRMKRRILLLLYPGKIKNESTWVRFEKLKGNQ